MTFLRLDRTFIHLDKLEDIIVLPDDNDGYLVTFYYESGSKRQSHFEMENPKVSIEDFTDALYEAINKYCTCVDIDDCFNSQEEE